MSLQLFPFIIIVISFFFFFLYLVPKNRVIFTLEIIIAFSQSFLFQYQSHLLSINWHTLSLGWNSTSITDEWVSIEKYFPPINKATQFQASAANNWTQLLGVQLFLQRPWSKQFVRLLLELLCGVACEIARFLG